jgi:flagellar hook-associated protein 2
MAGSVDGIASGLNTTAIIDAIMKVEHQPVDLYTERQTQFTQQLTSWKTVNTYLLSFKTQADVLTKQSLWNSKKVSSSDDTCIAATTTGSNAAGNYFLSVDQLAQNQQIASQGYTDSTAIVGTGTIEIKVGLLAAKTITLADGSNSLESLKNAINNADAGVTAAIINDGSSSNPYRLILSSDESGTANKISFTSSLSGGNAPNFSNAFFDVAEKINWSTSATSSPELGAAASYTGNANKTYSFTVRGTDSQTVGSAPITVDWTDGTNTGSITVNAAAEQVALSGTGSDGLIVSFGSGNLVAGDTFQIQAQAPTIQAAQDAIIRLGSSGSGGSPITVTSATNHVTSLIDGVTLDLKDITTSPVEISVDSDYSNISSTIDQFVQKYNAFADFANTQTSYSSETGTAGTLLGDTSLVLLLRDVRSSITDKVSGLEGKLDKLADIGIKFNTSGHLEVDSSKLMDKLNTSPDEVKNLFLATGNSTNPYISFLATGVKTKPSTSGYDVDVTRAAEQGKMVGGTIPDPSVSNVVIDSNNNNIKMKINGQISGTISLKQGTYLNGADLAKEIEEEINADTNLSSNDVTVSWVDDGDTGHFEIKSAAWGSNSKVELDTEPTSSAHTLLGLNSGTSTTGVDVAGTINGEAADGVGQLLTGKKDNATTGGLQLKITLTPENILEGAEGKIVITKGYGATLSDKISYYTDPNTGALNSRATSLQKQIDSLKEQITNMETILAKRREDLAAKYTAMEQIIANLQSQQNVLTAYFGSTSTSSTGNTASSSSTSSSS